MGYSIFPKRFQYGGRCKSGQVTWISMLGWASSCYIRSPLIIEESASSGPGRLGGHFPGSGPSSCHRCFPINFLLRIDDFRAWAPGRPFSGIWPFLLASMYYFLLRIVDSRPGRLGGHFPGSGPSSWHRCFPINFLLRIDDFRAWAPGRTFSGIWPFLLASMFFY